MPADNAPEQSWSFETQQIHAGASPDPATNARATPIYQTTSYVFRDTQHGADLFSLAEPGNIYTRMMNPTQDVLEQRIAALEGGVGAVAFASGSAAITAGILNLVESGDHVVSSPQLYGGTYNLFRYTLPKLGIEVSFVEDQNDPAAWQALTRPTTKLYFAESLANPGGNVLDVRTIADTAHGVGGPLMVDNTVPTPYLLRPIEHGADLVVHSATKYLGGHGTTIAGVMVDGRTFDFRAQPERFPGVKQANANYSEHRYGDAVVHVAYAAKLQLHFRRRRCPAQVLHNRVVFLKGVVAVALSLDLPVTSTQGLADLLESRYVVELVHS